MATATNAKNLELNKGDQILFAADVSASMRLADCPGGLTRIEFTKEQFKTFATEANNYDPDGADYFTFGQTVKSYKNQKLDDALKLIDGFQANEGSTDTAGVLKAMWTRAQEIRKEGCTDNIVAMIVTDGEPANREAVKTTIREITAQLETDDEFGIIFLTVGQIEQGLADFLKDLDDNLDAKLKDGTSADIVDVKDFMSVDFTTAFVGAVHD